MSLFPAHLGACRYGSLVNYTLAAGGEGLGRIVFARGSLADPVLGLERLDGARQTVRDENGQPVIVPVRAALCRPAPDSDLDRAPAARLPVVRVREVA